MHNNKRGSWRIVSVICLAAGLFPAASPSALAANAMHGLATVQSRQVTRTLDAYGQITPLAVVKIRALARGNLSQLAVVPGSVVSANQVVAKLTGPQMQSRMTTSQQNLQTARARFRTATQALHIARRKYKAQLTTQQRLDTAVSRQAAARAAVQIALAQLHETQNMQTLRAPVAGTVLSVQAANGDQMTPDQPVLTLQPANQLWLRAEYYGDDTSQLQVGMQGQFKPANNSKPIPVKIIAISPNLQPDSGRVIELAPTPATNSQTWVSGTWGKVEIHGKPRSMLSIPSSALILDHGHWWVLVHTANGDKPRQVIPGSSHRWSTTIRSGLKPGEKIVVKNAFLRYHRGIANRYMPPD